MIGFLLVVVAILLPIAYLMGREHGCHHNWKNVSDFEPSPEYRAPAMSYHHLGPSLTDDPTGEGGR